MGGRYISIVIIVIIIYQLGEYCLVAMRYDGEGVFIIVQD